ncbi:MAG: hypothetical protein C5B59_07360 [Bacteroidetes bacterium]|nr:MAG: hypothetical protein C5B59_07360 [Bacteroidota bacterium]
MTTIKERIYGLNKAFQKLYHDESLDFFSVTIPQKFNEIKEVIEKVIAGHPELKGKFREVSDIVDPSLDLMQMKEKPDVATMDNWLNGAKNNFSRAIWKIHDLLKPQIINENIEN